MAEPTIWPPVSPLGGREADVDHIILATAEGRCSSLVGMSNVGKSFTLRALCRKAGQQEAANATFVYIDCNRMVEFSDQGFYELVLRCMRGIHEPAPSGSGFGEQLERCYNDVVTPSTPFLAHLRFSEAISAACEDLGHRLVLVFDEFDEIMEGIDDRVLLNLRALRDSYPGQLSYVTASGRRLNALRRTHGSEEFAELFGQSTHFLGPLSPGAAAALIGQWVAGDGLLLVPGDASLLFAETGGHPGLLASVCYALSALRADAQAMQRRLSEAQIREQLDSDVACQEECGKFWQELDHDERQVLLRAEPADPMAHAAACQSLSERHLVHVSAGNLEPFCRLFAGYLHRQRIARQADVRGVRVDVEAGDVWVDGRLVTTLTDLEYRLLLLLYGHLDKIVDKYAVVEAVWGQAYIDEVDDARIEKLVSRLRQKVEANPAEPRYLLTVRGRGYRLASP